MLISGFDLVKHWRVTHWLDVCSAVLVSDSDLNWRATHSLNVCSVVLISGSDLQCLNTLK